MADIRTRILNNVNVVSDFFISFSLDQKEDLFNYNQKKYTDVREIIINGNKYQKFINEYWTSKQRQASSLHEISSPRFL